MIGFTLFYLYNFSLSGDVLMDANGRPTIVHKIKITPMHKVMPIVAMEDFDITVGHPILFPDGEWYRPDEKFTPTKKFVSLLYNFYCKPSHFLVVGRTREFVCSSLGGYCPRIARNDVYTDILFGRGYNTAIAARSD